MAKQYVLVGSVYDRFAKGNKFKEEEVIKIPGVTFNSLVDVDRFTSQITSFDLLNTITKGYKSKNTISIKVFYNEENSYFKTAIFNNKELYELLESVKKVAKKRDGKFKDIFVITKSNSYFNNNLEQMMKLLYDEDASKLDSIFGKNKYFSILINKYLKRDKFEDASSIIEELRNAFKDYDVFRTFIVNKNKSNTYTNCNIEPSTIVNIKSKPVIAGTKVGEFISKDSVDIDEEDDKEEFFDDKEIELMSGGEGNQPMYFTGRRL